MNINVEMIDMFSQMAQPVEFRVYVNPKLSFLHYHYCKKYLFIHWVGYMAEKSQDCEKNLK